MVNDFFLGRGKFINLYNVFPCYRVLSSVPQTKKKTESHPYTDPDFPTLNIHPDPHNAFPTNTLRGLATLLPLLRVSTSTGTEARDHKWAEQSIATLPS